MPSEMQNSVFFAKAIQGDQDTWRQLVDEYMPMVSGVAFRYTGNMYDAQDIVQEAFLQAYVKLPQLRDSSKFASWLRRITLNLCHAWYRQRKVTWVSLEAPRRHRKHAGGVDHRHLLTYPLPESLVVYPDAELESIEAREIIQKGMEALSDTLRSTFTLYHMEELNYQEIADRLGVPEGTVKRRLHDARRKLKEEVSDMLGRNVLLQSAVGVEIWEGEDKPSQHARVFGRGIHLPVACTMNLSTSRDGQEELYLHLLQGDSLVADECRSIGEFLIKGISPQRKGEPEIKLTLEIDASGKLHFRAKESPDKTLGVEGKANPILVESKSE